MLKRASPGCCIVVLGTVALFSCGRGSVDERISKLESSTAELALKLLGMELRLNLLANEEGTLDPTERGFTIVKANNGHFLVSFEDLVAYGDGQKITLRIGNPYNMTFNGFKVSARYGPRSPGMPNMTNAGAIKDWSSAYEAWQKSLGQKEVSFTDELQPGRWSRVTMILAPAKAEDVGFIGIKIATNQVSMFGR